MDKFPEAFERFERSDIDISNVRDSNDLIRKFRYWINRGTTSQQDIAIRREARKRGIEIIEPIGISERLGISREIIKKAQKMGISPQQLKRIYELPRVKLPRVKLHYTYHRVKGISRTVARIPKGQKGAGRFAKRT